MGQDDRTYVSQTFSEGANIVFKTGTGTKIATSTAQKFGFWNATPVDQPVALTAQNTSITHTAPGTPMEMAGMLKRMGSVVKM